MKNFSLFLTACLLTALTVQSQIPNPSFELWTNGNPDSYTTNNYLPDLAPVTQSDDAHEGSSSLKMNVVDFKGPGGAIVISDEFPYTQTEESLNGWYKGNFVGDDGLIGTSSLNQVDGYTVALGVITINTTTSQWTNFSIPMSVITAESVTNGLIYFQIFDEDDGVLDYSTFVMIDDLSYGSAVSLEEIQKQNGITIENIFPNPAGDQALVQYTLPRSSRVTLKIKDLSGKTILNVLDENTAPGKYRAEINTGSLSAGVYVVELCDGQAVLRETVAVVR